jgi:hypothetical protein
METDKEIAWLRELLKQARQYVADAGDDEDPEAQRLSGQLLSEIDGYFNP